MISKLLPDKLLSVSDHDALVVAVHLLSGEVVGVAGGVVICRHLHNACLGGDEVHLVDVATATSDGDAQFLLACLEGIPDLARLHFVGVQTAGLRYGDGAQCLLGAVALYHNHRELGTIHHRRYGSLVVVFACFGDVDGIFSPAAYSGIAQGIAVSGGNDRHTLA